MCKRYVIMVGGCANEFFGNLPDGLRRLRSLIKGGINAYLLDVNTNKEYYGDE